MTKIRGLLVAVAALSLLAAGCGDDDDTVDDALDAAESAASDAQDAASDALTDAQDTAEDVASDAQDTAEDALSDAEDAIDDATDGGEGAGAVTIANFTFSAPAEVAAGTTLTVTNDDTASHTMTADDGSFDTGTIASGESGEITFDAPGDYAFHCEIHPTMTGSITVA